MTLAEFGNENILAAVDRLGEIIKRRIKNTSTLTPRETVEQILREYMDELIGSGYKYIWRVNILEAAFRESWKRSEREHGPQIGQDTLVIRSDMSRNS